MDYKEKEAKGVRKVIREKKVILALKACKVKKEIKEIEAKLDLRDYKVLLVNKEYLVSVDFPV
jgi:hypothetical protein